MHVFLDSLSERGGRPDTQTFDYLILPDVNKRMLRSLVEDYVRKAKELSDMDADDIIRGRREGIVILLYGKKP